MSDDRRWTITFCDCGGWVGHGHEYHRGVKHRSRAIEVMPVSPVATCECCEQPTTRPYVHPVEGIDLCAPCVAALPREGEVPLATLREWIESQHLITRVADRLVAGSPMRAASNARGELLDSLSRLLDEFERTTNHNPEATP